MNRPGRARFLFTAMHPAVRRVAGTLAFGSVDVVIVSLPDGGAGGAWRLSMSLLVGMILGYLLWPRVEIAVRDGLVWSRLIASAAGGGCALVLFLLIERLTGSGKVPTASLVMIFLFFAFVSYLAAPGIDREIQQRRR